MPRPDLLVIGHAGSGFFTPINPFNPLPPNSWRSIARALEAGADGIEVDVRLSQDSIAVLYHDGTLEGMSTGRGCVSQTPAATLVGLHYRGGWPYDWFQKERPQTLETLLQLLRARMSRTQTKFPYLHLDLHEDDPCATGNTVRSRTLARTLARLLTRYQVPPARVLILTDRAATLRYLAQQVPAGVDLGLEVGKDYDASVSLVKTLPEVNTVVLDKGKLTPDRVRQLKEMGRAVVVFGGRSAAAVNRVVAAGPEAYQVDDVDQLRTTLRQKAKVRQQQPPPEQP
ncbi:hypothetical protein I2I05_21345 [Hymenobacter sp. BT683]|uniref:GP-PDE domain-containing protein n=1 Tax=Hymenobacter jeongseonensis TaxID=2791027 RepID=A0ABS0INQ0_9BACT|nr:glycerophosphodiester phosphodiesterase family protein [Hymenobacter jeongseonensis]MBF9239951.1 hypothetical protein [Hymenobacter jeongseonensis]